LIFFLSNSNYRLLDNTKLATIRNDRIDDDDSSDGGFKQRISASRPVTRTVKTIENSTLTNIDIQSQTRQLSQKQRSKFEKTSNSFDSDDRNVGSPVKRPTQLYFVKDKARFEF
jgi:hypothetical protein